MQTQAYTVKHIQKGLTLLTWGIAAEMNVRQAYTVKLIRKGLTLWGQADRRFQTCVCIDKPQYFHHGVYNGVLNRKTCKALNKLLQLQVNVCGQLITNWERIVEAWNANSARPKVGANIAQPDYSKLPFK